MQCTGAARPSVFKWPITCRGPVIAVVMPMTSNRPFATCRNAASCCSRTCLLIDMRHRALCDFRWLSRGCRRNPKRIDLISVGVGMPQRTRAVVGLAKSVHSDRDTRIIGLASSCSLFAMPVLASAKGLPPPLPVFDPGGVPHHFLACTACLAPR